MARILDIIPVQVLSSVNDNNSNYAANSNPENQHDGTTVPRQPNGRLRFPDAFLHPTPGQPTDDTTTIDTTTTTAQMDTAAPVNGEREEFVTEYRYKVQLMDEEGRPLEKLTRIVEGSTFVRDKRLFNRYNIQCFIRDCCYRENYVYAPWLIKVTLSIDKHMYKKKKT